MEENTNTFETPLEDIFTARTANQWLHAAKKEAVPKMLFGEFWLEGELALMFGESGSGKSSLAVQIAESIARGRTIEPINMDARPQKVLYLDFELSGKQFEMRYTKDHEPERGEFLKKHYRFSDRLYRVEINAACKLPESCRSFEEHLLRSIGRLARETGARVVIIDNITYLKRSYGSRECIQLMRGLNRLKKELGLSILVLARSERSDTTRPVSAGDLRGARILCNFADNVFSLGKSKLDPALRYVKHIKPRSTEIIHDASHVPVFRIGKIGKNFLGFEHTAFASEADHLQTVHETCDWAAIDEIKRLSGLGLTIRSIADQLEMSKSTVHRMLQMWEPPEDVSDSDDNEDNETDNCSKFKEAYLGEHTDNYLISRGMRPVWKEKLEAERALNAESGMQSAEFGTTEHASEPPAVAGGCSIDSSNCAEHKENQDFSFRDPHSALRTSYDGYGREIFVESEDPNGKPMIWYQHDSKGKNRRFRRSGFAIVNEEINGNFK